MFAGAASTTTCSGSRTSSRSSGTWPRSTAWSGLSTPSSSSFDSFVSLVGRGCFTHIRRAARDRGPAASSQGGPLGSDARNRCACLWYCRRRRVPFLAEGDDPLLRDDAGGGGADLGGVAQAGREPAPAQRCPQRVERREAPELRPPALRPDTERDGSAHAE